jgi:dTDP-4-dehydrorhamnose reductase
MKVVIVGASGTFGTAMEAVCGELGLSSICLTRSECDITQIEQVKDLFKQRRPDVLINAVAMVGINPCEDRPDVAFAVNTTAVAQLARTCEVYGTTLIQPSTHAVFDGMKEGYYTEDDSPRPTGIYSGSKFLAEQFAANLCSRHYIVRLPTMFGRRRNMALGFVDKMLERLLKGEPIKVASDKIDSPTYTLDAAKAVLSIVQESRPFGVYHVSNQGKASYYDFILKVADLIGSTSVVDAVLDEAFPALAHKPLRTALASVKIPPLRTWEAALEEYIITEVVH